MKNNTEFKPDDLVLIYKGTDTFFDGALAKILDRDPDDNSFIVADLEAVYSEKGDVKKLLKHHAKWVKQSNMKKVNFEKPAPTFRLKVFYPFLIANILLLIAIVYGLQA